MKKQNSIKLPKEILNNLRKIGTNVASGWGGECIDYEIDDEKEVVIFHCIEHGEEFVIEIEFENLEEENY
jgi:hypothetical protein